MSQRGYKWPGYWDEFGTSIDDEKTVPIRVGVIEVDGRLSVAIRVACASPVAITDWAAAEIGKLMEWAQREHAMLDDLQQQRSTEDAKEALDRAVLTRRQWDAVLQALADADPDRLTVAAAANLRAAAPRTWTGEVAKESQADVTDFNQAITWLDDIDAQLCEVATQLRELRAEFPDADSDSSAERRQVSADDETEDG